MARKSKGPKKKKEKKLSAYKKEAWQEFSKFIRLRDSNYNGYAKCCTCEVVDEWKYLQAGHFVAGRNNSILFDERNCHAQCVGCNYFGQNARSHGNYFIFMKDKYGIKVIEELEIQSNRELILKKDDFIAIKEKYRDKFKELLVKKGGN